MTTLMNYVNYFDDGGGGDGDGVPLDLEMGGR